MLCACTALNPLFGDGADGTGAGTTSAGTSAEVTTVASTSDEQSGTSTVSTTIVDTGFETSSSFDVGSGGTAVGSESGGACSIPMFDEVTIDLQPSPSHDPFCKGVWMSQMGPIAVTGNTITVSDCTCECPAGASGAITATIGGAAIDLAPACGYLMAWDKPDDGDCSWGGLAVFIGSPPEWIVSRTLVVPPAVFGGLTVDKHSDEPCGSPACIDAGTYKLEFLGAEGDSQIKMDEEPKDMSLPFNVQLSYTVDDVTSVIDEACVPHWGWTASLNQ
jgi:hypothetical protein